jgi:hypothetical protein
MSKDLAGRLRRKPNNGAKKQTKKKHFCQTVKTFFLISSIRIFQHLLLDVPVPNAPLSGSPERPNKIKKNSDFCLTVNLRAKKPRSRFDPFAHRSSENEKKNRFLVPNFFFTKTFPTQ